MTAESDKTRFWVWIVVGVAVVALDQVTKFVASTYLEYGQPVVVLPVFNLTLMHNTGAAFSFLSDAGGWQRWFFTVVSAVVSVLLLLWIYRLRREQWWLALALALILGGALGNLIDRVLYGYVVDFISVHYDKWFFPAFNIADSGITVGAGMMIIDIIRNPHHHQ